MTEFSKLRAKSGKVRSTYMAIAAGVIIAVAAVFLYLFNIDASVQTSDADIPRLNITRHAIWDDPVLGSDGGSRFEDLLRNSSDSAYYNEAHKLDSDVVSQEEALRVCRLIDNMPNSRYKGTLQIKCLNNLLFTYTDRDSLSKYLPRMLERGFEIVQGDSPLPQSLFFNFWNNVMLEYSNLNCPDSVENETQRLMRICRQQHQPIGMMFAYMAFGYNLMDIEDFQAASSNFDAAMDLARRYYPEIAGKNWRQDIPAESDYLEIYYQIMSFNALCHLEANDSTWLRDNEKELLTILDKEKQLSVSCDIYYALAIYYDKWVSQDKYEKFMARYKKNLQENDCLESEDENLNYTVFIDHYYIILVRHELRAKHGDAAMALIQERPAPFDNKTTTYYPDALLLQGKYEEAAKRYKYVVDNYYKELNGHNRNLIHSLSADITEENHRMEQMQAELESKQTHIIYNTLLTFILVVMLAGLSYFLYRQRKLNRKLSEALTVAEKASQVREAFLGNITHELNTPLNAIYGFAQLLADRSMPLDQETVNTMADEIVKGSSNLINLMHNIVVATDKLSKLDHLEDVESIMKVDPENKTQ